MHVPLAQHEQELLFGEARVNAGEWQHVEGQIPCGVPWVLPFVRDRDDVAIVQVLPLVVALLAALRRWSWLGWVSLKPLANRVVVKLLRPEQAAVRLHQHSALLLGAIVWEDGAVELATLLLPRLEEPVEILCEALLVWCRRRFQPEF